MTQTGPSLDILARLLDLAKRAGAENADAVLLENASLGVTLCAECALVGDLVRTGRPGDRGRLIAFACVGPNPGPLLPCGRCRQLLFEHGGDDLLIDREGGPVPLSLLFPDGFSADHLP